MLRPKLQGKSADWNHPQYAHLKAWRAHTERILLYIRCVFTSEMKKAMNVKTKYFVLSAEYEEWIGIVLNFKFIQSQNRQSTNLNFVTRTDPKLDKISKNLSNNLVMMCHVFSKMRHLGCQLKPYALLMFLSAVLQSVSSFSPLWSRDDSCPTQLRFQRRAQLTKQTHRQTVFTLA